MIGLAGAAGVPLLLAGPRPSHLGLARELVSLPVFYMTYRRAPEPKRQLTAGRYVALTFLAGALAYVVGTTVGILAACSSANAGNLCGLTGVFGVGPVLAAGAITTYDYFSTPNARRGA
jgi:hypothetical protein